MNREVKNRILLLGLIIALAFGVTGCAKLSASEKRALKKTAKEAIIWYNDKYHVDESVTKSSYETLEELFGYSYVTDVMYFTVSDGSTIQYTVEDQCFADNRQQAEIESALSQYLKDSLDNMGYRYQFMASWITYNEYSNTLFDGDVRRYIVNEPKYYATVGTIYVGIPEELISYAETDVVTPGEVIPEGTGYKDAQVKLEAILEEFESSHCYTYIYYVSEQSLDEINNETKNEEIIDNSYKNGGDHCIHMTVHNKEFCQYDQRHLYIGDELYLCSDTADEPLENQDFSAEEVDLTLDDLEGMLDSKTFDTRPSNYKVLKLTPSKRLANVWKNQSDHIFRMRIRADRICKIYEVNIDKNDISEHTWSEGFTKPGMTSYLWMYSEKPIYVVVTDEIE